MTQQDWSDGSNGRTQQQEQRAAAAVRRLQRKLARAKARPARSTPAQNMLTSFGMVVGLLMIWAMAVNM